MNMEDLRGWAFAHRGLHGPGVCENTLEAFSRAVERGYGIELDVHLSRAGEIVVFHDKRLTRLGGDRRRVRRLSEQQRRQVRLPDGSSIPRLEEVLRLVAGRVPLLIELKQGGRLPARVLEALSDYEGPVLLESFSPLAAARLRRLAPERSIGQLVDAKAAFLLRLPGRAGEHLLRAFLLFGRVRPDFLALDVRAMGLRRLSDGPVFLWTIRDAAACDSCRAAGCWPVFEGFLPEVRAR